MPKRKIKKKQPKCTHKKEMKITNDILKFIRDKISDGNTDNGIVVKSLFLALADVIKENEGQGEIIDLLEISGVFIL